MTPIIAADDPDYPTPERYAPYVVSYGARRVRNRRRILSFDGWCAVTCLAGLAFVFGLVVL